MSDLKVEMEIESRLKDLEEQMVPKIDRVIKQYDSIHGILSSILGFLVKQEEKTGSNY